MKRTTNKIQREYMAAKALVQTLEEQEKQMEQAYIAAHGIVNPDGTTPERIYCIMDEAVLTRPTRNPPPKLPLVVWRPNTTTHEPHS